MTYKYCLYLMSQKKTKGWKLMDYLLIAFGSPNPWTDAPSFMEGNEKHYLEEIIKFLDNVKDKEFDKIVGVKK